MRYSPALPFALLLLVRASPARATAPPDTLRPVSADRLLGYTYANDLFFRTDYYFTQGMTLTLVHPALARSPVRYLLPGGARGSQQHHGITLRYDGFTPLRIQDPFIRVGDRPYAAYVYASFFRVSTRPGRQRLTTALEAGFIGPAAGGKELQTAIHRVTNNSEPRGWGNQVRNDLVLGYRGAFEKQLLAIPGRAELLGSAEASLSTLYTYAGTGVRLRAGRLNPYLANLGVAGPQSRASLRRWQLYGQATFEARLVGYNATLQGGIFTDANPYTIAADDVRRALLRGTGGVVLACGGFSFAATGTWVSPEFAGGRPHRWGQLGITAAF
ncbi:lipid A deacylase LpxR family protein [Hymenobacter sp.]|uniref:lipid A deacylase LpxR family protein n=1 Tax=Hymenobacter sp. TaxID=1898978 RepID=UPI00286C7857|nr:lipid A deacylase LpxR family protein [Hymenobacter sp.]